jgi:hypothetical protein
MADIPSTKDFTENLDNSDLQIRNTTKDIASAYTNLQEAEAYVLYLKALKLEAELNVGAGTVKAYKNGKVTDTPVKELVPVQGKFTLIRRAVIQKLNTLQKGTDEQQKELKQLMSDFETDSTHELSSRIANFLIDKERRDGVNDKFKDILA